MAEALGRPGGEPLGLYIHIPFCARKCRYCDFLSFAEGDVGAYVDALVAEIALLRAPRPVTSVFVGGGTPSLLPSLAMARVFDAVVAHLPVTDGAEITIEANPGTLTRDKLREYKQAGINRLSIGAQSTHDELLLRIGRIHTAAQVFEAVALAREAGFANINVDLMRALPGQTAEQYLSSLRAVAELGVEHISAYSLIVEEGTPLCAAVEKGEETLPTSDDECDMERRGIELLRGYGYKRYEVSNYAKPGRRCRHNENYWRCGEYLAAGLGASSAIRDARGLVRRKNLADMGTYLASIARGTLPVGEEEVIDRDGELFEVVMLGLRLIEGIDLAAFFARFSVQLTDRYPAAVSQGVRDGLLVVENGHLRLSERGMDIQNTVLLTFLDA